MTADELFSQTQRMLRDQQPDYSGYRQEMAPLRATMSPLDQARTAPMIRLADALQDYADKRAGGADIAALLRGVCRTSGRSLQIRSALWAAIERGVSDPGLMLLSPDSDDTVIVDATTWRPGWLAGAERIDALERRMSDELSPGDGVLFAMTGASSYLSDAQKEAVHAFLFAAPGSTTIVTMPTGSGKSLCAQLPAWSDSRGGTIRGGTTLVIVPTVALAIDQQQRTLTYFRRAPGEEFRPQCWIGGMPKERRAIIRRGLAQGTLPILFLSPEALIGSELHDIALEAARVGTLRRLIIDEAHLVETWGAGFRTDFQFLSTYRRQLLDASGGVLRTLLLTATLTGRAEHLLEGLFAERGRLSTVHAGRLRPEIGYWMHLSRSWGERRCRVLEAIRHLPRPLILYATAPEHAEQWLQNLWRAGYLRAKSFTGNTTSAEREARIKEWGEGRIDIMCATSAFGLGIDKRDVRAVIHACVPENVDRFYQEVGRGGRDGCSAISLLCAEPGDFGAADGMVSSARITGEKALPRWLGMLGSGRMVEGRGDTLLLDLDASPDRRDIRRSSKNRDWNEHTLLLAQRARLLVIEAARADVDAQPETSPGDLPPLWMRVRLRDPDRASDQPYVLAAFEAARSGELDELFSALGDMRDLLNDAAGDRPQRCLALALARSYPDTALACGGCPACRAQGEPSYVQPLRLSAELYHGPAQSSLLSGDLAALIAPGRALTLQYDPPLTPTYLIRALVTLLDLGVQQFVLPEGLQREDWAALARHAAQQARTPHRLVAAAEVLAQRSQALFAIPTAAIYPQDQTAADQLHLALRVALAADIARINIAPRLLYLPSECGRLIARVEGLVQDLSALERIGDSNNLDLF
jgi:superfamily II DNA/RNA helicase